MSASFHSDSLNSADESPAANRLTRATTALPTSLAERNGLGQEVGSLSSDKLRSLSCEFIDSPSMQPRVNAKSNKISFAFKVKKSRFIILCNL